MNIESHIIQGLILVFFRMTSGDLLKGLYYLKCIAWVVVVNTYK